MNTGVQFGNDIFIINVASWMRWTPEIKKENVIISIAALIKLNVTSEFKDNFIINIAALLQLNTWDRERLRYVFATLMQRTLEFGKRFFKRCFINAINTHQRKKGLSCLRNTAVHFKVAALMQRKPEFGKGILIITFTKMLSQFSIAINIKIKLPSMLLY